MKKSKYMFPLIIALFLAAAMKGALIVSDVVPFNSDEAVVGLMARNIIDGERPIFFYGQAYMGSFGAFLISLGFLLLEDSVETIRIVQSVLYLFYILTVWLLVRRFVRHPQVADFAALFAAFPPVLITLYTTATLGGYVESIILGNLVLFLGYEILFGGKENKWWLWLILGLICGLAFWTLGIAGVYIFPLGILLLRKFTTKKFPYYLLLIGSFLLGSLPWWLFNIENNWAALISLGGPLDPKLSIAGRTFGLLAFGIPGLLGLRFPWLDTYLPWYLSIPILLLSLIVAGYFLIHRKSLIKEFNDGAWPFLALFVFAFLSIFILSSFGVDSTGRYFLPLFLPLTIIVALVTNHIIQENKVVGPLFFTGILGLNLAGTLYAAVQPLGITTQLTEITQFDNQHDQELMQFLSSQESAAGYSNHWISYRLAFLSQEEIILSAELPFKEDIRLPVNPVRIPEYAVIAENASRPVYATSKHPILDAELKTSLLNLGVDFQEKQIGPFHIFYDLSQDVAPEDLGLATRAD